MAQLHTQHTRTRLSKALLAALLAFIGTGLSWTDEALALPQGPRVEHGDVSIQPDGASLQVTASDQAIIEWSSFDIAATEAVRFLQPSSTATALNRVVGGQPSQIAGALAANGWLFLINPAGIVFAPTAVVQVGSLVASSLGLSNDAFLARHYQFIQPDGLPPGLVANHGSLTAEAGGFIALLGGAVVNTGVITARLGTVALAGGSQMTLSFDPDGRIAIAIDAPTASLVLGPDGQAPDAVVNTGQISAEGGTVLVTASALHEIFDHLVNQSGIIEASAVVERDGRIFLVATGGTLQNAGTLSANTTIEGRQAGQVTLQGDDQVLLIGGSRVEALGLATGSTGGTVQVLGKLVGLLDNAQIDVSGQAGGGTVLVGGDLHGQGAVTNAWRTYVGPNTIIRADALTSGNGGKVIVWADDVTKFYGSISGRGGSASGNGGFAEVSGKNALNYRGTADLGAVSGLNGTLLLDPATITIVGSSGGNLDGDDAGTNATALGSGGSSGQVLFADTPSAFTVYESEIEGTNSNIILQATNGISTSGTFGGAQVLLVSGNNLTLTTRNASATDTGTGINLTGSSDGANLEFKTQGSGTITIQTGTGTTPLAAPITVGKLTTGTGSITISGTGTVTVSGALTTGNVGDATSGAISLTSTQAGVVINASVKTGDATVADAGGNQAPTSGNITVSAGTSVTGSDRLITGNASLTGSTASGTTDVAKSGSLSVTAGSAGVSGGIGLSNANALTVGTAQRTTAVTDTATAGSITLTSRDEINNGTSSTALGLTIGAASGATTNNQGTLTITTSQSGGNIYITSASALTLGAWTTASGSAQTVTVSTTGGANLTVNNATEVLSGDAVTLDAGTGTLAIADTAYEVGAGSLTLTGDEINLTGGANSIRGTGGGTILLQPKTVGQAINVGGADSGLSTTLDLLATDLAALKDGFAGITIGRTDGTGLATIGSVTFTDPVTIRMPGVGGRITLSGALSTAAVNAPITLTAGTGDTGTFTQTAGAGNTINAGSGAISITADAIVLNTTANTITGTGSLTLQPASVARPIVLGATGAASDFALSTSEIAALTNGFSGITIGRADGQHAITISAVTFNDPVTIQAPVAPGSITVNGQITGAGNASITLKGSGTTTTLNANLVTNGQPIDIEDSVIVGQGHSVLLDTTNSGGTPAGAVITITGTTDGTAGGSTETLTVNAGTGTVTLAALGSGSATSLTTLTLTNAGTTNFNGALNLTGALTQTNAATGATTFANTVSVGSATLKGTSFNVNNSFTTTGAGAIAVTNSGTFTKNATGAITAPGGFSTSGNVNLASNITTTNTTLSIGGNLTIADAAAITLSTQGAPGVGDITITGNTAGTTGGAGESLTLNAGTGTLTFTGYIHGFGGGQDSSGLTDVTITKAGTTNFNGTIAITGALTQTNAATGATTFSNTVSVGSTTLRGTTFDVKNSFTSSGAVAVTNAGVFTKEATGAIAADGGFSTSGDVNLANNITTNKTALTLGGALVIADTKSVTLSTQKTAGAGDLTITGATTGTTGATSETLTLNAGTGTLSVEALYGSGTAADPTGLTDVTLTNAGTTNFNGPIALSGALTQTNAATGATTFANTVSVGSATLKGTSFNVNNSFTTTAAGALTITNSGTLTIASGISVSLDGPFTQDGVGPVNLGSGITTTNDTIAFSGPVTLTDSVTLDTGAGAGNITFNSTLDDQGIAATQGLILKAGTGSVFFKGVVGNEGDNALGNVSISGTDLTAEQSFAARSVLVNNTGTVTFDKFLGTDGTIDLTGTEITLGDGAGTGFLGGSGDLVVHNSGLLTLGGAHDDFKIAGSFSQEGGQPVSLASDVTIDTTKGVADGTIKFTGSIDSDALLTPRTLTLDAGTGTIQLDGAIGSSKPLQGLTVTSAVSADLPAVTTTAGGIDVTATAITLHGDLHTDNLATTGPVTLTGPVNLAANVTIDTANTTDKNITITGAINSSNATARDLTLTAGTGTIDLQSAVGATNELGTFTVTSATQTTFGSTVKADDISLTSTTVRFTGDVTALTDDVGVTGNLVLLGDVAVTTGLDSGDNFTVSGTINADAADNMRTLTLRAGSGDVILSDAIGSSEELQTLTISSANTASLRAVTTRSGGISVTASHITLNGDLLTENGQVDLTGLVTLGTTVTINTIGAGTGEAINFNTAASTIDATAAGAEGLTLTAGTGTVTLDGDVGADTALGAVAITGAAINLNAANLLTQNGRVDLTGPVTLGTTVTIDTTNAGVSNGASIETFGTINSNEDEAGPWALTLTAGTSAITLDEEVGGDHPLLSLEASGGALSLPKVTTFEHQSYTGSAITLNGNLTVLGDDPGPSFDVTLTGPVILADTVQIDTFSPGGTIHATSTIDGDGSGPWNLTLTAGSGNINLEGAIGSDQSLQGLTITSAASADLPAVTTTDGGIDVTATDITLHGNLTTAAGAISLDGSGDAITLATDLTLDTTADSSAGVNIDTFGPIDSDGDGPWALTLTAGTGAITLHNNIGLNNPLAGLTITSAASADLPAVTTEDGGITVTATDITLHGTLTTAGDPITLTSGGTSISLADNITLDTTAVGDSSGADITLTGTVDSLLDGSDEPFGLTLTAGMSSVTVNGAVGSEQALASLTVNSANNVEFQSTVATVGELTQVDGTGTTTFHAAATIGGDVSITTGSIAFEGSGSLESNSGTGSVTLTAQTGAITSTTGASNVIAHSLEASAETNIGTDASPLLTQVNTIQASTTDDGDGIFLTNTGDLTVTGSGLVVSSSGSIHVRAGGDINVNADITGAGVNVGGIQLLADNDIIQATGTTIEDTSGGDVRLIADNNDDSGEGGITMNGTAQIRSNGGDIVLGVVCGPGEECGSGSGGTGQNIVVGLLDAGAGTVKLRTEDGGIQDGNGAGVNNVVASDLVLRSEQGIDLDTAVARLDAFNGRFSKSGDIVIRNTGNLAVEGFYIGKGVRNDGGAITLTTDGDIDIITAVRSSGSAITITADNMTIGNNVNASGGTVTLQPVTEGRGIKLGAETEEASLRLTSDELNHVSAGTLKIGNADSGDIDINAAIAPAGVTTLSLETGGAITQDGGATITVSKLALRASGPITLTESNDVDTLAARVTGSGNAFAFTDVDNLTVGIVDDLTGIKTENGALALTANNMTLEQAIDSGTATTTLLPFTAGQLIDLGGADGEGTLGLTDEELDLVTAGTLQIGNADSGDITVTASIAPAGTTTLSLETGGKIVDGNEADADLTVANLALIAGGGIASSDNPLETSVTNLEASGGTGGVFITNAGALTIGGVSGGLTGVSATGGDIAVEAASPLTIDEPVENTGGGSISLTAGAGEAAGDNLTINAKVSASGGDGNVTLAADDDVNQNADVSATGAGSVTVTSTNGAITMADGTTTSSDTGDITYTAGTSAAISTLDTGGNVSVTANGGAITDANGVAVNISGETVSLTADGGIDADVNAGTSVSADSSSANGDVDLTSTVGDLPLGVINAGSGSVTLAAAGAITDANGASNNITATSLSASAATGIDLDTAVTSLSATTTGNGAINLDELDDVTLTNLTTTGAGSVTVTSGGSMTLGTVKAAGHVDLTASGTGSILGDGLAPPDLTATSGAKLKAGGTIGTLATPLTISISGGALVVSAAGAVSGVSMDMNGTVNPILTIAGTPPGRVLFNSVQLFPPLSLLGHNFNPVFAPLALVLRFPWGALRLLYLL